MNRVTPATPLQEIVALMERDGYVLMENALTPQQLAEVSGAYDEQLRQHLTEGATRVEIKRVLERDPRFEQLMDLPSTFRVVRELLGYDVELASGGELDHKMPHTPAHIPWHNDFSWMANVPYPRQNFWLRCTYFMADVAEDTGPFTLLPGSHSADHNCPREYTDEHGQPREIEGMLRITGPAGSCLINNTEIWHTNTPNRSDQARPLIMICYKHSWMKQWQEGYEMSTEFTARQTDPVRQQLCGRFSWHNEASAFPLHEYQIGNADEILVPVP